MTVQTLKLGRERFVILREQDYRQLQAKAHSAVKRRRSSPTKVGSSTSEDLSDVAEARQRRHEPIRPYSQLRKELGLR